MSENLVLNVRLSNASRFTIGSADSPILTSSSTILQLKQLIARTSESGNCEVARQRIIYKGRILSDNSKCLREYGLTESDQTIHLVKGSAPASTPSPNLRSTTNPNSTVPGGTTNIPSPNPNPTMSNMNPFMSMMQGNNNNNGSMFPDMSQLQQMQQQAMQNPEMMNSIMNSPMMQSMMSNPELIRTMMESNPQMRQLLETNPELRHMLDDPELMRRSMEMMRDPNAMRNAMRNNDLAMSQIENIPGGFSALRRMYEDVQEPMMDAMASGSTDTSATGSSPSSSETPSGSGAAGTAMPNPWGAPATGNTSGQSSTPTSGGTNTTNTSNLFGNNTGGFNPWASAAGESGMSGMPGMPPNMNLQNTLSMLENPMISQMMDQMMSNPEMMQSMMDSNPMIRQMRESNPEMAAMMTNPETMRQMMNPSNLRAMMQMQNAMQQLGQNIPGFPTFPSNNMGSSTNNTSSVPGATPTPAPGVMDFTSLFNQLENTSISAGAGTGRAGASTPSSVAPEQRYRMQLQSLNDMGFDNNEINIQALTRTHGNVNRAVDLLFTDPSFQSTAATTPVSAGDTSSNPDTTTNESSTASAAPVEENIGGNAGEGNTPPSDKKND